MSEIVNTVAHFARIINANEFEPLPDLKVVDWFKHNGGIKAVVGKLKGKDKKLVQAYRFDSDKYTPDEAKKWLKKNEITFVDFEEAEKEIEEAVNITLIVDEEVKLGARHSKRDMQLMKMVHTKARDIQSHMKELGLSSGYKSFDEDEPSEDEMKLWSEGLTILEEKESD